MVDNDQKYVRNFRVLQLSDGEDHNYVGPEPSSCDIITAASKDTRRAKRPILSRLRTVFHCTVLCWLPHRVRQVLYGCLWLHERLSRGTANSHGGHDADAPLSTAHRAAAAPGHAKKVLSEPLSLTLSSIRSLSRELSQLGALVGFTYLCEHHPPFPHGKKVGTCMYCTVLYCSCTCLSSSSLS